MKLSIRSQHRSAGRGGPSVSLFPFLAVLICTMGVLVPLLLAITRTARLQAEATARAKVAEKAVQYNTELRTKREDARWAIKLMKESRRKTEAQLADARLALGNIEAHTQQLRGKLRRYEGVVAELEGVENAGRRQQNQSEAELQQVRGQIDAARQQLTEARKNADQHNRSYAVVPYEGPNHTRRRPIYIECCADAVVLQPEAIRLPDADFADPMGPGNPLAVALRTICQWMIEQRAFDPNVGQPYPMLLVRPDGIPAYYAARAAMKSWGSDFGYELIGDDWRLAYQPPDPRLAEAVGQAVASARIHQARLIAAAPSRYEGRGTRDEGRGTDSRGQEPGEGGAGAEYNQYVGATERPGAAALGGSGSSGVASQGFYGNAGGNATGGQGRDAADAYNPYVAATERPGTAVPGGTGSGGVAPYGSAYGTAYGTPATGAPASTNVLRANAGNGTTVGSYITNADPASGAPAGAGRFGDTATTSASSGTSAAGGRAMIPDGYVAGRPPRESATSSGSASSDGPRGYALRPGEWEPTPDPPPKTRDDAKDDAFGNQKHTRPDKLTARRGDDWGLRDAARGAIGITRPIGIECYADRLVVVSDRNPSASRVIALGSRTASSIDPFVSAVWGHIDDWGIAGRGMYWRPVLQVSVAPGADDRFADLAALLEGSGLRVERK